MKIRPGLIKNTKCNICKKQFYVDLNIVRDKTLSNTKLFNCPYCNTIYVFKED